MSILSFGSATPEPWRSGRVQFFRATLRFRLPRLQSQDQHRKPHHSAVKVAKKCRHPKMTRHGVSRWIQARRQILKPKSATERERDAKPASLPRVFCSLITPRVACNDKRLWPPTVFRSDEFSISIWPANTAPPYLLSTYNQIIQDNRLLRQSLALMPRMEKSEEENDHQKNPRQRRKSQGFVVKAALKRSSPKR